MLSSARQLLLLPLLPFVSSSLLAAPLAAAQATTTTATSSSPWRPTPLRASPPTASLAANASTVNIQLRYKTWDGNFLDVVELAAGKRFLFFFFFLVSVKQARREAIFEFFCLL